MGQRPRSNATTYWRIPTKVCLQHWSQLKKEEVNTCRDAQINFMATLVGEKGVGGGSMERKLYMARSARPIPPVFPWQRCMEPLAPYILFWTKFLSLFYAANWKNGKLRNFTFCRSRNPVLLWQNYNFYKNRRQTSTGTFKRVRGNV